MKNQERIKCLHCNKTVPTQENGILLPHYSIYPFTICPGSPKIEKIKFNGRKVKAVALANPDGLITKDCYWGFFDINNPDKTIKQIKRWLPTGAAGDTVKEHMHSHPHDTFDLRVYIKLIDFDDRSLEAPIKTDEDEDEK